MSTNSGSDWRHDAEENATCKRDASLDIGASIDRPPRNEVTSSPSVLRPLSAYKSNGCAKTCAFVYDVCASFYDTRVVADRKIELCFAKIALSFSMSKRDAIENRLLERLLHHARF